MTRLKINVNGQISLSDFKQTMEMYLKDVNCWVKKIQTIPWLEIEKRHAALLKSQEGHRCEAVAP